MNQMSSRKLLCRMLVAAVEFTEFTLLSFQLKLKHYFYFSTSFNKFVYVFNLNPVDIPTLEMD